MEGWILFAQPGTECLTQSLQRKEEDEQEILLATNAAEPLAPISWLTYSLDWTSYSRGEQGLLIGHGASLHAGQNAMI
jgi:hypothetical protein